MSRLAKKPIVIPNGVDFKFQDQIVTLKGAKGSLSKEMPKGISIAHEGKEIIVTIDENQLEYSMWGLYHALINSMIEGVSKGFQKKLSLVGVGYRATLKGDTLELALGFSHPSLVKIPAGIKVTVDKNVAILVEGCDHNLLDNLQLTFDLSDRLSRIKVKVYVMKMKSYVRKQEKLQKQNKG